jgi:hypothetical protein
LEGTNVNFSINPPTRRPARILFLLGLVAVASIACTSAATGGGPGASSAPSPSAAPSVAPSPAVTPVPSFHVVLEDEFDSGATVDIVDRSGTLVSARAAAVGEAEPDPGAPSTGDVTVKNVDPTTLWIGWGAGNCPDVHELVIEPDGRTLSISQPPFCGGDTVGVGRTLVLTFAAPIAAGDVTASLVAVAE